MKKITLIRHAKVQGEPALYGATDIAISEQEKLNTIDCLYRIHSNEPITEVISSPLRRCVEPSIQFCNETNIPLRIEPLIQEINFGSFDGLPFSYSAYDWSSLEKFYEDPTLFTLPNSEKFTDFEKRVMAFYETFRTTNKPHSVVVTHGGTIKLLLSLIDRTLDKKNVYQNLRVDNLTTFHLTITDDNNWQLSQPLSP